VSDASPVQLKVLGLGLKPVAVPAGVQRPQLLARLADQVVFADEDLVGLCGFMRYAERFPGSPAKRRRRARKIGITLLSDGPGRDSAGNRLALISGSRAAACTGACSSPDAVVKASLPRPCWRAHLTAARHCRLSRQPLLVHCARFARFGASPRLLPQRRAARLFRRGQRCQTQRFAVRRHSSAPQAPRPGETTLHSLIAPSGRRVRVSSFRHARSMGLVTAANRR
jgi:hypothetical protein